MVEYTQDPVDCNDAMSKSKDVEKGKRGYLFFKRLFDIVASFCAIVLLSWLMIIISIIVKKTSEGPVLFKDYRVGQYGKEICVYKFRTMYIDAEEHIRDYLTDEQYEEWLEERKVENDPRITPIGRFLRRTSLDELPQLFNIFVGTLTVVGPSIG